MKKSSTGGAASGKAVGWDDPRVGTRLRYHRLIRGLSLKELADKVGCSESMVSKIENHRVHPSFVLLHKLAGALETNIANMFSMEFTDSGMILRQGQRPVIDFDHLRQGIGIRLERLVPPSRAHLLQANIHIVAPGGSSDGQIDHVGEEMGYVLAGQLELTVGAETFSLSAGDSFHFRSEVPHGYRNPGENEAQILWVNTPPTF